MVDRAKHAAWGILGVLMAAAVVIGFFTWMTDNPDKYKEAVGAWGNAGSALATTTGNWVATKAGGEAATADVPEKAVVWVNDTAPARWPVRQAVARWNKGLTSVTLRVGPCHSGSPCVKVSEVSSLPPQDGALTLGRTTRFLGTSVRFNRDAVGRVPRSYLAVSACHELGHALGLGHRAEKSSCMYATVGAGSAAHPDAVDFNAVDARYGN